MVVGSRQNLLVEDCGELNIKLDNQPINRAVEYTKLLGMIIDDRLSWSNHEAKPDKETSPREYVS